MKTSELGEKAGENYYSYTDYTDIEDKKRLDFIISTLRLHIPDSSRILDVGCGNGNISRALGSCGYQVTGIDISKESIAFAQRSNPFPNVNFKVSNAEDLKVDEVFQAIVCSEVLEHLHRPEELLMGLERLLEKGNILIVTVPNGYGPRELLVTRPVIAIQKHGGGKYLSLAKRVLGYNDSTVQSSNADLSHVQFFTEHTLRTLIEKFNFSNISFENANFIEKVFPVSLIAKRSAALQKVDCEIADSLPTFLSSGFYTAWKKN